MRGNLFQKIGTLVRPGTLLMGLAVPHSSRAFRLSLHKRRRHGRNAGATMWVATTQRLKTKVYENRSLTASPILIVVVHGDSPDAPTYQYRFAQTAAAATADPIVAAVLRPGYSDGEDRSDGMRGETTGDNYTPEVINAVAAVISELKARYKPRRVVLVGHSGGSAIVGSLIGQQGSIANPALLVSCVCDLEAWRKHMRSTRGGQIWERPVRSLPPLALIDRVPTSTKVSMLVGSDDQTFESKLRFRPSFSINVAQRFLKNLFSTTSAQGCRVERRGMSAAISDIPDVLPT